MSLNQWKALFRTVRVVGSSKSVCSVSDLDLFESQFACKLPVEYREYAEVFGHGVFDVSHSLYVPGTRERGFGLGDYHSRSIAGLRRLYTGLRAHEEGDLLIKINDVILFLDRVVIFGVSANDHLLMWDTSTYSDDDGSAEFLLFVHGWDAAPDTQVCALGRSLYRILSDLLLGDGALDSMCFPSNFDEYRSLWKARGRPFIRMDC